MDDPVRTSDKDRIKRSASALFLGTGDVPGAVFEARVHATVCGQCLGVRKAAWRDDKCQPGKAGDFTDTGNRVKNTHHFDARKCTVIGLPIHGEDLVTDT